MRSVKSIEIINKEGDGPYRGFGYLKALQIDLATWSQNNNKVILQFSMG